MMLLLWLVNLTCSGPSCPKDLLNEVFSCLQNLTNGTNQSSYMYTIDVEIMQQNCRSGAFRESVQCLKRLKNRRNHPATIEWLEKLARPQRWEAGFQRLCKHVTLYSAQKQCIYQQTSALEACVRYHSDDFTNNKDLISYIPNEYRVDVDSMKSICSVFYWTDYCLSKPLGLSCGEPVSAIIRDFQGGITPPVCIDYNVYDNSSSTFCSSKLIVILCMLLKILVSLYV